MGPRARAMGRAVSAPGMRRNQMRFSSAASWAYASQLSLAAYRMWRGASRSGPGRSPGRSIRLNIPSRPLRLVADAMRA